MGPNRYPKEQGIEYLPYYQIYVEKMMIVKELLILLDMQLFRSYRFLTIQIFLLALKEKNE